MRYKVKKIKKKEMKRNQEILKLILNDTVTPLKHEWMSRNSLIRCDNFI